MKTQSNEQQYSDNIDLWFESSSETDEHYSLAQKLSIAHQNVEAEKQKFETLFDNSPAAMAILKGPDFVFERVNTEYLKIINNREVLGKPIKETLPELCGEPIFYEKIFEVYNTGISFSAKEAKTVLPKVDVSGIIYSRYVDITYKRIDSPNGDPYGIFIFASDVTEKVNTRKHIQESESEFRALAEVMPQIIFTSNTRGDTIYFNERWEEYTGRPTHEGMGKGIMFFHHPDDIEKINKKWKESIANGTPYQVEFRLKGKDQQYRWFLARAMPMRDESGKITKWVGTKTDIHEQKILSQKLESIIGEVNSSKLQAESANNAKSAFLANMSHEIRTPLGSIIGFIALMRNAELSQADLNKYISITERNSEQLLRIIDDILDLSKVEAGKLVVEEINFKLTELLADVSSLMKFRAQENGILFQIRAMTELPEVIKSDPTRIKQILGNAVGNAIKFTSQGTVELQVSYIHSRLKFSIIDSGVGISEQQASQLFQPFTQADISTSRKYGGTGLGLILTKRLCEAMNGEFYLQQSQLGVGSTFVATVKVGIADDTKFFTDTPSHFYKPAINRFNKETLLGKKILVVDDLEDNLTLINVILNEAGAIVTTISDPYQGIKMALGETYDLILMDIQMPMMNGYEVTRQIKLAGKSTPIVALTAHAMKEEKMRALDFGFSAFLPKPINANELIQTLCKLICEEKQHLEKSKKVIIVEDDPDLKDLLQVLLQGQNFNTQFMLTAEDLLDYLKAYPAPDLILVDFFLPKMSGAELISTLNWRSDRNKFKIVIASGTDEISEKVKLLKADGYLKKPYNSRSIVDSIRAFLL